VIAKSIVLRDLGGAHKHPGVAAICEVARKKIFA
jgi:hypothetical protein